jgi:hypothetical protein
VNHPGITRQLRRPPGHLWRPRKLFIESVDAESGSGGAIAGQPPGSPDGYEAASSPWLGCPGLSGLRIANRTGHLTGGCRGVHTGDHLCRRGAGAGSGRDRRGGRSRLA